MPSMPFSVTDLIVAYSTVAVISFFAGAFVLFAFEDWREE